MLVLSPDTRENSKLSNSYPLSFVIFLVTLGLTFGAYFNKLISYT